MALSSMAVPAKRGVWRLMTLTDGTEVRVQLVGDEFMHYYVSEDGTKYVMDATTGQGKRLDSTASLSRVKKAAARRAKVQSRQKLHLQKAKAKQNSFRGTRKGLVILAEFSDRKFQSGHDLTLYKQIVNGDNYKENGFRGSVKDYFCTQSMGQFELNFDVVGICPLQNATAYYGANSSDGEDLRAGAMIAEACLWAKQQGVDFSKYDWDNDGEVEQVFVLYAGKGEANGGAASTIWPHMYALSLSDYGKVLQFDGLKVDTYACSCELNGLNKLDGIGTFCHEFSHCLDLPDLYDTSYTRWFGLGEFDLMDSGSYNGDGKWPAGYSAYEKASCGWITLHDLTDIEEETKVADVMAMSLGGDAYIIRNKAHEDECYIIENRQKSGWDTELPGAGVMITHVDYDADVWYYNVLNSNSEYYDEANQKFVNDHPRLTIFRAGKSTYLDGSASDLYPYLSNSSLTATSQPASTLYNKNADGSKYMHLDIKNIAIASDGSASFTVSKAERSGDQKPDTPVQPSGSTLLYESFDKCHGTGGNDNLWKGSISGTQVLDEDLDNGGWTSTETVYEANGCVRLGKSGVAGNITTPTFSVKGSAILSFKAAAWDEKSDATKLYLEITDVNNGARQMAVIRKSELSKYSVPLKKGEWTQLGASVYATGEVKVSFTADKGRFFLDEVKVTDNTVDGIAGVTMPQLSDIEGYYTPDGIRFSKPQQGVNIIRQKDGRVRKVMIY